MKKTNAYYLKAKKLIPGGTQLFSKRPELFHPDGWPAYYSRAKGVDVWDLDGRHFVDMTLTAIGACPLGFADPDVDTAVKTAIDQGSMTTLNCPEEVELAELLCELHPWAEMVRYARGGGEAMAIAVRIARAATGKDQVAFCGYHGWHDWYLSANLASKANLDRHLLSGLEPKGVPRALFETAFPFSYNDIEGLETIVRQHGNELAAIVMEPIRHLEPKPGFLEQVRATASRIGAVLIFDEVSVAWRMNAGGIHLLYDVRPDVAVFAKAMSNGYPMAAVIGRREVMEAARHTFISSTYWTERIGPTAAIAAIQKMRCFKVPDYLVTIGNRIREGWLRLADRYGLKIQVKGIPPLSTFDFEHDQAQALFTLFTQKMLEKGFLASRAFYATYAHQSSHVDAYMEAADEAFGIMRKAVDTGCLEEEIRGPLQQTGFARLA